MTETKRDVLEGLEGFTPGGWVNGRFGEAFEEFEVIQRPDGGPGDVVIAIVEGQPEREANARLIARAPELVDEVRRLRTGLQNAIRALEDGRVPRGGHFLRDLRALLPETGAE